MRKKLSLIIFAVATVCCLVGCSAITKEHYYSPKADNGEHARKSSATNPIYCSGSADHVTLTSGDFAIEVSVKNIEHKSISVGPLVFPVIPVFFLDWFTEEKILPSQLLVVAEFVKVPDDFNMSMLEYKAKFLLQRLALTTKDGKKLFPSKAGIDWESLIIIYDIDIADLDWFTLDLDGIVLEKKILSFPLVEFKKSSGWVWHPIR